jgi:anti-anti-sigma regulatory factor
MTNTTFNIPEAVAILTEESTELVRGHDQELLQRVLPLVRQQSVTLDLRRVQRIDAAGIAGLILLYRAAIETGHSFTVSNLAPHVGEILALVGLDRVLLSQHVVWTSHLERPCECPAA